MKLFAKEKIGDRRVITLFGIKIKYKKKNTNNGKFVNNLKLNDNKQTLDMYFTEEFANILETWAEDNAWQEIQLLLTNCKGKVLDIACGTGIAMNKLSKYNKLDLFGFDISDLLIQKAIGRGINKEKLQVCDATKTNYKDNEFNYSYSIGSLEHFTEEGIDGFLSEAARYTKNGSFHMIPISNNNQNMGWIKTIQTYYNNTEEWWLQKFKKHFNEVYVVNSSWKDEISDGKWFLCYKNNEDK